MLELLKYYGEEEIVITSINQLHDSLDKLEIWILTNEGLLDNLLQIPDAQLLRWQDGDKMI